MRQWRRGSIGFGAVFVTLGVGIAVAGAFTTSNGSQGVGGSGLFVVGGVMAVVGIVVAIFTDWIGRRYGVRFPDRDRFGRPRR
jgi:hypothetical protein